LIEAVHWARGIIIVGDARGQLEWTTWQNVDVEDAGIDGTVGQAGGATCSSGKPTAGKDCPSAAVAAASVAKGGGFVSLGAVGAAPVSGGGNVL